MKERNMSTKNGCRPKVHQTIQHILLTTKTQKHMKSQGRNKASFVQPMVDTVIQWNQKEEPSNKRGFYICMRNKEVKIFMEV
jgi:hypothetical protein